ncbi:MAG: GNAT family N-acetyltransferase [Chloroflexota bacterium]
MEFPHLPGIPDLVTRHFDPAADYPAVVDFLVAVNTHDVLESIPTIASLRIEWESMAMDPATDVLVAEVDGEMVGLAHHDWRQRGARIFHHMNVAVGPAFRHRGLGRALVDWTEAAVAASLAGGDHPAATTLPHILSAWAAPSTPGVDALAARMGYAIESYGMMMVRALADPIPDLALPDGLEVRPVRPEDHRRIWDADTEAFRDHRNPAERTDADFVAAFADPDTDTSLWQVAWDGDEVAGSVMNTIYPEENAQFGVRRVWLDHITVRRPWRRRGLASALISRSLRTLQQMGLEQAALGADTENLSGAVKLYESLGFRQHHVHANYVKPIEVPGTKP